MKRVTALLSAVAIGLAGCAQSADWSEDTVRGEALVRELGCLACHGQEDGVGPAWTGAWGTSRRLADGSTVVFDGAYIRSSVLEPAAQVVMGFDPVMPSFSLTEDDLAAIVAYLEEST
ncbi:MAG: cytochrome c [Acidimicrobiia bacterium]|nr:cytochrome c [Acidimicrobiia bacterium]